MRFPPAFMGTRMIVFDEKVLDSFFNDSQRPPLRTNRAVNPIAMAIRDETNRDIPTDAAIVDSSLIEIVILCLLLAFVLIICLVFLKRVCSIVIVRLYNRVA